MASEAYSAGIVASLVAVLAVVSCSCSGCGGSGGPYASCETKQVVKWEALYICDAETPQFASSASCLLAKASTREVRRVCNFCDPSQNDTACANVLSYPMEVKGSQVHAGYVSSSCATDLPEGEVLYSCDFLSQDGCYVSPGCYDDANCSAEQFVQQQVHGCAQHWVEWSIVKEVCLCEGRPYMVDGSSLQAQTQASASGSDSCHSWGSPHADLGGAAGEGLAVRLRDEAMRSADGSPQHAEPLLEGTLALEAELPELLQLARTELAAAPTEEQSQWKAAGLAEHAAVAAFAKLNLELLVAGAPPRLLRLATRAQEEELLHAHVALGLAGVSEGRLDFPEHELRLRKDLGALRQAALAEGIEGEGRSALRLFARAMHAKAKQRPHLARLAWAMAADEARHAELAAETLRWLERETGVAVPEVTVADGDVFVVTPSSKNIV